VVPSVTDVTAAFSHYEVKNDTNLISVLADLLKKDPRYLNLGTQGDRDKVLYRLLMKHYIEPSHQDPAFYQAMGIASGNPFDIKRFYYDAEGVAKESILDLDGTFNAQSSLDAVFKESKGVSDEIIGFQAYLPALMERIRVGKIPFQELDVEQFLAEYLSVKGQSEGQ
jgi:hypothetical protein